MKYLDPSFATDTAEQPVKKGTIQFIQDSHRENLINLFKSMIGSSYSTSAVYILSGAVNTGTLPSYVISNGVAIYNNEVFDYLGSGFNVGGGQTAILQISTTQYTTDADPVTFTDASVHNVHNIRKITAVAGTSGAGILDYANITRIEMTAAINQATDTLFGVVKIALLADTILGSNNSNAITPLQLRNLFSDAWTLRSNIADVTFTGGAGLTVLASNIKYWKPAGGKLAHLIYSLSFSNTSAPTGVTLTLPTGLTSNAGFIIYPPTTIISASGGDIKARPIFTSGTNTIVFDLSNYEAGAITYISGSLTYETT